MKSTHRKTLKLIFDKSVSSSLKWRRIEALFLALGAKTIEGRGSRVRFELNGVVATFHRPHPHDEAKGSLKNNFTFSHPIFRPSSSDPQS